MEHEKGSLEAGNDADFIILDQDIMKIPTEKVPGTSVVNVFIRGKLVSGSRVQ